jgi:signal transduction histidine kinase
VSGWTNYVLFLRHAFTDDSGQLIHVALAARCNPLLYSVTALWPVYAVSLLLVLVACFLLLKNIRRELTQPLEQLSMKLSGLTAMLPDGPEYDSRWQEPYDLERKALSLQQRLQEAKAEARQLQTQLEYAKNAEEYRRRMISGLTHELKTPLAVIHSYAEGLQEGIAQEKKEQYLGVILEESEKMDAMVLQMLDLSRLEAGKVKLSNDRFSLAALTQSVFDRLMPLAEEKGLTVRFTMPNECQLTADEGRIGQVITNLASNAIKYTPEGGEISVIVYRKGERNVLCVENTCERLSTEALEKVFDSFYRGDAARTTEGTGLGLAIVKAIVEQHGGSCRVFNTPTGVQFQVVLP